MKKLVLTTTFVFLSYFYSFSYFTEELMYLSMSAREKSLGNRYVADILALSSNKINPSLLTFSEDKQLYFNYNNIYDSMIKILSVGYIFNIKNYGFRITFVNFDLGKFTKVEDGQFVDVKSEQLMLNLYNFGFGYKLFNKLSVGLNTRYFDSKFLGFNTSLVGLDVGLLYMLKDFNLGFVIEDIFSTKIKVGDTQQGLSPKFSAGINYKYKKLKNIDELNFEFDFIDQSYSFSVEAKIQNFCFRFGYDNNIKNFGSGVGFIFNKKANFRIDYSYSFSIMEEKYKLPDLHSLSFVLFL
ncbi:MAG: hypothetical protein N2643_04045 [Endomicrobia bacterium]|nr:hypothetical protein [Endomicrobiia bacterium]